MKFVALDSNILLRSADSSHPMYQEAVDATNELLRSTDQPCLIAQNLVAFRAVATRPVKVNGLGMSQSQADAEILRLKNIFPVYSDEPGIFPKWENLVKQYGAAGNQNHDARIVAAMIVHGISTLLTFNKIDFIRYPEIKAVTPTEMIKANL